MPDRFSRNGARAVALGGLALFLVILGLLAVQMASGKDPALGAGKPAKQRHVAAVQPAQPVQPAEPAYVEPGYDDGGYSDDDGGYSDDGGGYSDDGSSQDGYAVPQQQSVQPQQQQSQAPLQSSTS